MELTSFDLYWITRLDAIRPACTGILFCGILVGVGSFLGLIGGSIEGVAESWMKTCKWGVCVGIALIIVGASGKVFVPSTKEAAFIWGVPAILNSEAAQVVSEDTKEIYKLGVEYLKDMLKEVENGNS